LRKSSARSLGVEHAGLILEHLLTSERLIEQSTIVLRTKTLESARREVRRYVLCSRGAYGSCVVDDGQLSFCSRLLVESSLHPLTSLVLLLLESVPKFLSLVTQSLSLVRV
jgi:hypothetical protein